MIEQFRPKSQLIEGLQIVTFRTTKRQILDFCPGANVGAPAAADGSRPSCGPCQGLDAADLRWIILPNGEELVDGDWILRLPNGDCFRCEPDALDQIWERA